MSTLVVVVFWLVFFALVLLLWGGLLRLGLAVLRVKDVSIRKIVFATLANKGVEFAVGFALLGLLTAVGASSRSLTYMIIGFGVFCAILIPCVIIAFLFSLTKTKAFVAWIPTLVLPLIVWALLTFGVQPLLIEAYKVPTNGMAPTLIGPHFQVACPECGGPAYGSLPWRQSNEDATRDVICSDNFHVNTANLPNGDAIGGDRILVAKYMKPRRWDLVVFKTPFDPSITYVKRLVGLPGETITIYEGKVLADGEPLDMPANLQGLTYEIVDNSSPWQTRELSGSLAKPAVLGEGEYFMLGDFSIASLDSRYWEQGVPGHPPYAVPENHLVGVVTHVYWPPSRWQVFR